MVKTSPFKAGGLGLISVWGAEIPHASQPKIKSMKQKPYCHKFNKDLKKKRKKEVPSWTWGALSPQTLAVQ